MKYLASKSTIVIVCIMLLFSFFGCKAQNPSQAEGANYESNSRVAPFVNIHNYSEYLAFLDSAILPNDFVIYEDISHFGNYVNFFSFWPVQSFDAEGTYNYILKENTGYELFLTVKRDPFEYDGIYPIITDINHSDMRYVQSVEYGVYIRAGIIYQYNQGAIRYLKWEQNDIYYVLEVRDHPLDSTVVGQLLNIEGKSDEELISLVNGTFAIK